jgi:two-component system, OmpR family, KDP operon response regulator KdpE
MTTAVSGRERILIADGDPLVRRFVGALLANNGYDVHLAEDGESALRSAVSLKPRLLLIDLVLPGRDGFEVLHALRGEPSTASVPVMILSVKDREEDVVKALGLGVEDYVSRPFSTQELLARIRRILERTG